jgi:hypothetical protein
MFNTDKTVRGTSTFRSGRKSLVFFSFTALVFMATAVFLLWPSVNEQAKVSANSQTPDASRFVDMFNQVVRFDGASGYSVYGERGVIASGDNLFRGAVGGGANAEMKGIPESSRGNSDVDLASVRSDIGGAFSALRQLPTTAILDGSLNGRTFGTGFYSIAGTTLDGELVFDAQGDPNAVFSLRVDGNFETAAGARVRLINGAQSFNVHITVDGDALIGAGSDIRGSIVARGNVDVRQGSTIKGQTISVGGTVSAVESQLGNGTGVIEICKAIAAGATLPSSNLYTFTFPAVGGGNQTVTIPAGVCSGPREVPTAAGPVQIRETYPGGYAVSGASAIRVGNVPVAGVTFNSLTGIVTVPVLEGDLNNETTVTIVNQPVRGGFIEICKYPSAITAPVTAPAAAPEDLVVDPVTGVFEFRVVAFPGENPTSIFVPVNGCSLPLFVQSFTATTTTPTFTARITEVGRTGILLESVTTIPANRLVGTGGGIGTIGAGGYADVTVVVGDAGQQVIVNFFNRSAPGEIKICKIAGPGVPVGTDFTFDIRGTAPGGTSTMPTFPGTIVDRVLVVPAGPGPEGFCRFVRNADNTANQTYVVGRRVSITERPLDLGGFPAVVTRIDQLNGANITENLAARNTMWDVLPGIGVATFTNTRFQPTTLKVCKIGTGNAAGGTFTFDLLPAANQAAFFENGFNFGTTTAVAGSCSTPIANLPADVNLLIDERAATGVANTASDCQAGTCSVISRNLGLGQATIDLFPNVTINEVTFTNASALSGLRGTEFDFDGDGKADPSIFRPSNGAWWVLGSTVGSKTTTFGQQGDIVVAADYDGDLKTDYAIYRGGQWHILGSTSGYSVTNFGLPGDIPQPGDYDNDGKADAAVYRPSNGTWYFLRSTDGFGAVNFGISSDIPVAGDFDGDGRMDPAVYRNGIWHVLGSTTGYNSFQFGLAGDRPVQADYDGDGKTDPAVYRGGTWYLLRSTAGFSAGNFGVATDMAVPADYDGDRKADIAVYRPSTGVWHIMRSSMTESGGAYTSFVFGIDTDTPVPY